MVLSKQQECLPCFGGDGPNTLKNKKSSGGDVFSRKSSRSSQGSDERILKIKHNLRSRPMNLNLLALPKKRYALSSWQQNNSYLPPEMIEQLQGIVQGEYKGVNVSKCAEAVKLLRKRREAAKAAADAKIDPCCCKGPCTLISSLLKKLKNTSTASERKSLTCIIFNELCKISGADPCKKQDEKRNTALALAKKFGAWIDDMLEKKGTIACGDIEIDPKTQKMMGDIFECPCCQKKKEYPERKPKIVKPKEAPPRPVYQYCPPKKTKKKKPKKKKGDGDGDEDGLGGKGRKGGKGGADGEETEEERALRLEAEAKAAAEAAAAEAATKAAAACKAAAAEKRKQAMEEQMARQREEVAKQANEKPPPPPKVEPQAPPSQPVLAPEKKGKRGGDDESREKKAKVTTKAEPKIVRATENVVTIPPNMKICVSASGGGVRRRGRGTSSSNELDSSREDQSMSDQDSANVIEQYSKIVQHFLGTLDDMNDWIQNLVRETDQVIIAKIDGSDMNVLGEVEQDWKIFKNKMFLKTHHWKYFNRVAKKMVSQLQETCNCETKGGCKCPGKQCANRSTDGSIVCHAKHMKLIRPDAPQHGNNSSIISEPPSLKQSSFLQ